MPRKGECKINECGHTEKPHYCKGMCSTCYKKSSYTKERLKKWRLISRANRSEDRIAKDKIYEQNRSKRRQSDPIEKRKLTNMEYKRKYGITHDDYDAMLFSQGGLCASCGKPETSVRKGKKLKLAIDHNHETGLVRGLLCMRCNRAIGLCQDSPEVLQSALNYLQSSFAYEATLSA